MKRIRITILAVLTAMSMAAWSAPATDAGNPRVRVKTTLGTFDIELFAKRAPKTVESFLHHVDKGYYNKTIFHRVIPGFMVQGGGFQAGMKEKPSDRRIPNEADNGLRNTQGTVAMARTPDPHSASTQFFINTVDNPRLDHRSKTEQGWGYAVFGRVIRGMDVVKKIESVPTGNVGYHEKVPHRDVVILRISRLKARK